jgi:hypothetical protein
MAQTVALARGSVTCTANGTHRVTVYTNSASYVSTRVIVNSFVVYNSTVPYFATYIGGVLSLIPNGQRGVPIGMIPRNTNQRVSSVAVLPFNNAVQSSSPTVAISNSSFSAANSFYYNPVFAYPSNRSGAAADWGTFNANDGNNISDVSGNFSNSTFFPTTHPSFFASNFYMGPSDVLSWWAAEANSTSIKFAGKATQTVYYNFTLIHES